jgi:thymidylate synthase (FAD)
MTKLSAKLVAVTQPVVGTPASGPEDLIAYCARVSSDRPQEEWGKDYEGLLNYCKRNKHWSVFEMADAIVEIEAPRDISRQLLRHRSFSFQEFSQRYSDGIQLTSREFREQDDTNRQNSIDSFSSSTKFQLHELVKEIMEKMGYTYTGLRDIGVAKECARVILPEGLTMSKLFMKGSLRSWIHYLDVRDDEGVTQWEHVQLARKIREAILPAFPTVLKDTG